jgi:hypothetical protein
VGKKETERREKRKGDRGNDYKKEYDEIEEKDGNDHVGAQHAARAGQSMHP